jgi:hypothetical protein
VPAIGSHPEPPGDTYLGVSSSRNGGLRIIARSRFLRAIVRGKYLFLEAATSDRQPRAPRR